MDSQRAGETSKVVWMDPEQCSSSRIATATALQCSDHDLCSSFTHGRVIMRFRYVHGNNGLREIDLIDPIAFT